MSSAASALERQIPDLSLTALSERLSAREVTSGEATRVVLERIAQRDDDLRSYAHLSAGTALAAAEQADREIAAGTRRGALHGVPLAVKDLFLTEDAPTMGGGVIPRDDVCRDATVVRRLREAGAVLLGKLQTTEGAYSDHHPSVAPPRNPWSARYWTGISSSGPGVAVAAGLCFGALASDTGGSIRWPSAACGVTGLKPSWGRVSRAGVLALAPSLDHVGVMARTAADTCLLFAAIAGQDPDDPTALAEPLGDLATSAPDLAGVRIGFDPTWNEHDVDDEVRRMTAAAAEAFRTLGATIVTVEVPEVDAAVADWPTICAVEAAVAHEGAYAAHAARYGPVLAGVIEAGQQLSGTDYQKLLLRLMDLRGRFDRFLSEVDVLLCPVQPFAPISLETLGTMGERPDLIARLQRYTCVFDMTGHPTITLPGGFDVAGLPMGFQLVARRLREDVLVRLGMAYQAITDWHERRPPDA